MKSFWPHEVFRLDFDKMAEAGRIQEGLHPANVGESAASEELYTFFDIEVLPLIKADRWVFEAATTFAEEFAADYFRSLRLQGQEIYLTQQKLQALREEIHDFVARAWVAGYKGDEKSQTKLRDFTRMVNMARLPTTLQQEAAQLLERAIDHEGVHLEVVLRSIANEYERAFPRIFFVIRRALTVSWKLKRKKSNNTLQQPANYIDWYRSVAPRTHILNRWIVDHWEFYQAARNVGSHHVGLQWNPEDNSVILKDKKQTLTVDLDTFSHRHRYFVYFTELGVRGILAAFAERERGPISNRLIKEYEKTFPDDWEGGQKGTVLLYK